jgi:hypothetical protein
MFRVIVTTLAVMSLAAPLAAAPVYSPVTGSYYDYVNRDIDDTMYTTWSWQEARADAESRSYLGRQGHLVTITSAAEEQVLIDNWFADILYGQPHIGGFRLPGSDPLTGWQWVTGEPFTYANWRIGEPNNAGGGELYLHYQSVNVASVTLFDSWGWNDMLNERRGYFIEYSAPVPEPSLLVLAGMVAAGSLARRRRSRW